MKTNPQPFNGYLSINLPYGEEGIYIQGQNTELVAKMWEPIESRPASGDDCTLATAELMVAAYNMIIKAANWLNVDPVSLAKNMDLAEVLDEWGRRSDVPRTLERLKRVYGILEQ